MVVVVEVEVEDGAMQAMMLIDALGCRAILLIFVAQRLLQRTKEERLRCASAAAITMMLFPLLQPQLSQMSPAARQGAAW